MHASHLIAFHLMHVKELGLNTGFRGTRSLLEFLLPYFFPVVKVQLDARGPVSHQHHFANSLNTFFGPTFSIFTYFIYVVCVCGKAAPCPCP